MILFSISISLKVSKYSVIFNNYMFCTKHLKLNQNMQNILHQIKIVQNILHLWAIIILAITGSLLTITGTNCTKMSIVRVPLLSETFQDDWKKREHLVHRFFLEIPVLLH